jgi:hypothetical protein
LTIWVISHYAISDFLGLGILKRWPAGDLQAIKVTVTDGDQAGRLFVVFNANGDGAYTAGADYVFAFENPVTTNLEATDFFV